MAGDLQVFPLAITGGINQSAPNPQPTDYEELENFGIYRNRIGLRAPLEELATITSPASPEAILDVTEHANRLYVLSWSSVTDIVYLHSMQVDGTDIQSHGTVHSTVVTKPVLQMTSMTGGTAETSTDRLYISDYDQNLPTKYWNGTTITTATADLNNDNTAEDLYFGLMIEYKFHLWGTGFYEGAASNRPEMIRFSQPGLVPGTDPGGGLGSQEWFSTDHRSLGRRGDKITSLQRTGDRLLVFQKRAVHAIYGSGSTTWTRQELSNVIGAVGPFATTTAENRVCYFWASDGPYRTDGASVEYIGEPIRELASSVDAAEDDVRAVYSPDEGLVYFLVASSGTDEYSLLLIFNHRLGVWSKAEYYEAAATVAEFGALATLDSVSAAGPAAAPTGTSATATSDTTVDLVWVNGDTSLGTTTHIYRSETPGFTPTDATNLIDSVGTGVTTYEDTTASQDTLYYYKLRHFRNNQHSAESNQLSDTTWLAEPTNMGISGLTNGLKVTGTNNAPTNSDVEIYRKPAGGSWSLLTTLTDPVGAFSHSDTTASCGTTYSYRAKAVDAGKDDSEWSAIVSREACDIGDPPTAPTIGTATANSGGDPTTEMVVTWTDNSDNEDAFEVWRAPDVGGASGTYVKIAETIANIQTYTDDAGGVGLSTYTTYWYKVKAKNVAGESAFSAETSGITDPDLTAPTDLVATAAGSDQIDLTWTDTAADESGWQIWRAPDVTGSPGTYSLIHTAGADATSYSDTGLSSSSGGETYWYKIRAVVSTYTGAYSNQDSDTVYSSAPPQVTGFTATVNGGSSTDTIDLAWTDVATETGYEIFRRVEGGEYGATPDLTPAADASNIQDTGLDSGTQYWYKIRAVNASGNGVFSTEDDATTTGAPPAPADPSGFTATVDTADLNGVETNAIDLAWTDNSLNETGFRIERCSGGGCSTWTHLITLGANVESYRDATVFPATTYSYRIRAENSGGNSNWVSDVDNANEGNVTVTGLTATDDSYCTTGPPEVPTPRISLNWTNGGDDDSHETRTLERKVGSGSWSDYDTGLTKFQSTYTDTGVSFGTFYYYRIKDYYGTTGENTGTFTSNEDNAKPVDPGCDEEF